MFKKPEPKNKNITIRVTNKQFEAFNNMANKNDLSRSEWGYHLLFKQKNIYRRNRLIHDVDIKGVKTALIHRILETFHIKAKTLYNQAPSEELRKLKLAIKILDMTTFKSDDVIDELIRQYRSSVHRSLLL